MKHVCVLLLSLAFSARTWAMGGSVPSGYPSTFMMGYVLEAHVDTAGRYVTAGSEFNTVDHYMAPIGSGWSASYKYLIGGPRAANGANCWWNAYPGSGGMPTNMMNLINSRGYQPIFIYENLQGFAGNYAGGIYNAFQSTTFMGQYFSDWADLMTVVNTWLNANPTKIVTIDVEPDVWGYMQQNYNSNPASIPASVASAANPGAPYPWVPITQFPNTVQGAARAMLHIKDVRLSAANRSKLKLAFHVSSWAVAPNPATQQGAVNIATHAASVAGFVNACKTTVTAGANWDLIFLDPADGDAALYQVNGLDPAGTTHWWDPANATQPTFNRYRDWVNELSNNTSLRAMLWQMPIGNQVYKTMSNTHGHYQDNRAEYFLNATNGTARICDWANNGVIGILWGRGSIIPVGAAFTVGTGGPDYWYISWATDYSGGTQDNITNAGPAGTNATLADDDGGYLRSRMPSYFSSPCTLPGVGTPTPTSTRTPNFSPTISPTHTQTPVCPGGYVDGLEDNNATNQWGGTWSLYNPGGGTTMAPPAFACTTTAPGTGTYCARINGSVTGTNYPSMSAFLNAGGTAVSVCTYNAFSFQFKGSSGVQFRVQVHSAQEDTPTVEYNDHYFNITGTGAWQTITIPYGSFTHPGWGRAYALDCAQWRYISWLPLQTGAYDFSVDEVQFLCLVNTPTPTVTPTRTRTATPSASPTQSASPSPSGTRSATPSATPSPTPSASFTASPTRSASGTASATGTPSATRTDTRTATPTGTASASPSASPTRSSTGTFTPTFTVGAGSATASPTLSATVALTPTPTRTATASATRTATGSFTVSPSVTPSYTIAVGSPTASPTHSGTLTHTPSATRTASATATRTATGSFTVSPSATPTFTIAIGSPTATPTLTPVLSATPTATPSSTASPAPTGTQTPVASVTNSPVATASSTPAATATSTPAATATASPTVAVATSTGTPSLTRTPTPSFTASPAGPGPASTATQTPGGNGPNEVLEAVPYPHPNPQQLRVKLAGPSDALRIQIYSRGYVMAAACEVRGSFQAGWNSAPMPAELSQLPAGTYFFRVQSLRQGTRDLSNKAGRLVLIR